MGKSGSKLKQVKKEGKWNRSVVCFRVANRNLKKVIGGGADRLVQVKKKGKKQRGERTRRTMAHNHFRLHSAKPEFGGYPEDKLRQLWDKQTSGQEKADSKGVVNGVGGHARFRIYLDYDDSHSESEDVEESVHEHGTKPGEMSVDDTVACLTGDADLQLDFDAVEFPPELGEGTPQPASSP